MDYHVLQSGTLRTPGKGAIFIMAVAAPLQTHEPSRPSAAHALKIIWNASVFWCAAPQLI